MTSAEVSRTVHPAAAARHAMWSAVVLTAVFGLVVPGAAGPPFVTDDPDTPEPGGWEINLPVVLEREGAGSEIEGPVFDVNYGLRSNVQLMVEGGILTLRPERGRSVSGMADMAVGLKWRFLDEQGGWPALALYPQVSLPTGDEERGLGDGRPAYVLPLVVSRSFGRWTLFGNVGRVVQTVDGGRDYWFHGLVVEREIGDRLSLAAEVYGNSPYEWGERSVTAFNVGGTLRVTDRYGLLFSAGRGLSGGPDTTVYLGLQVLVGGRVSAQALD